MKDDLKYIDKFYKNSLGGYEEETATVVWGKLRWTLFWMRYKWYIAIGSVVLLLGIGSASYNLIYESNITNESITELKSGPDHIVKANETTFSQDDKNYILTEETLVDKQFENNTKAIPAVLYNMSEDHDPIVDLKSNSEYSETLIVIEQRSLSNMKSLDFETNINQEPDSNLMGYNRRTDVLPPNARKQWLSINIYAGPSYSESTITGFNSEYLAFRNLNESNSPGWSLGSDLRVHIKNWIITSGVSYSVYNQSRSYIYNYQEYSPDNSYFEYDTTWVWVFDPPDYGTPIVSGIDSAWVKVYEDITIDNSGLNQLKYFEIPLMIGYRHNSNMFAFEINAGVSAGFLVYSQVKAPDFLDNNHIVDVEQMNKTMINFVANASLYYYIDRKTSLFISPYYKQNLHSIFNENYPVKQQFKTIGINFGVNILF